VDPCGWVSALDGVGFRRAYQPRIAIAMPNKIWPIDSWNVPGVGESKMVIGIETTSRAAAQRVYTRARNVAIPNRMTPMPNRGADKNMPVDR
jgi:hypothetical protein